MSTGRQERKHAIYMAEYQIMCNKIAHVMQRDPHTGVEGQYRIRSVYFDNLANKILHEKKEGYLTRDKYRVRLYNLDQENILLERKSKRDNLTYKTKCPITKQEYQTIQRKDISWMEEDERLLIRELYTEMYYCQLRPVTIVDYIREPFIYPFGNVRITFDFKVQSSFYNTDIFHPNIPMIDVLEENTVILEVKYDDYLPDVIKYLLQLSNTQQEAYSKYQLSRMYG
ncbi:polyphosphate polymerase domain-containing protein [Gracilibacillus phocaeensis]|uniref:polyphosphate polymerase domain-containing protein n=1 Tax=Gracilibacillus phocaeensis TaxID=2042304 RepID=UPI0010301975|nr:polyphosphate polymerase domain-containing protein [Gracilibacillus phocaeensis]